MYAHNLQTIHDLQNELTGSLGVAANNPAVTDLLTDARRVVHQAAREFINFQRHGTWNNDVATKMQAAVDGVMNPLVKRVNEIRKMTPGERRMLGQPPRRPTTNPGDAVNMHREMVRIENERDEAVAVMSAAEALGAKFSIGPAEHGIIGYESVLVDGMDRLPAEMQAVIRARKSFIVGELSKRTV